MYGQCEFVLYNKLIFTSANDVSCEYCDNRVCLFVCAEDISQSIERFELNYVER